MSAAVLTPLTYQVPLLLLNGVTDWLDDMSIADLMALLEVESTIPTHQQVLTHNDQPLHDTSRSIGDYGIRNNDMVLLLDRGSASSSRQAGEQQNQPSSMRDTEMVRLQVLGDPRLMYELKQTQPDLADAVHESERFATELQKFEARRAEAEREKQIEMRRLHEDPFDEESQRKIEEIIQQQAVLENLQSALEHNPECKCII